MSAWKKFPYDNADFDYAGARLKKAWPQLHAGDCEPYPANPDLQQAWRHFHSGEFEQAVTLADEIGIAGHAVANKATGIYATYLEDRESRRLALFQAAIARAEQAIMELPGDPNSHYFHAFNLGRYSQGISVIKALKQGMGGKIAGSLNRALELQPAHAEAHTALGMYHAEILDKVGRLIGSMTYGASEKEALKHFRKALELNPTAPIAHIEYGNGLYLMFNDDRLDEVTALYVKAAEMTARDAMEKLDIESALAELE